jgi:DedD protein
MERRLKERLTGAAILVMLGVIFIPMILDDTVWDDNTIEETNIPRRPAEDFDTRMVPLGEPEPGPAAQQEPQPEARPEPAVPAAGSQPEPKPEPAPEPEPEPARVKQAEEPAAAGKKQETAAGSGTATPEKQAAKQAPKEEAKPATAETAPLEARKEPAPAAGSRGLTAWVVQIGSFSNQDNANNLIIKLRDSGYPAFIEPLKQDGKDIYRVRIGPELLRSDANALQKKLAAELDMEGIVLQYP